MKIKPLNLLPFQGSKRRVLKYLYEALEDYDEDCVFVDLFGGSLALSVAIKNRYPSARVICNDYDNQQERYNNIDRLHEHLCYILNILKNYTKNQKIEGDDRDNIINYLIKQEETGYVDYLSLSSYFCYGIIMCKNIEELKNIKLYNKRTTNIKKIKQDISTIEFEHADYIEIINKYKDVNNVVFIADPPYMCTNQDSYNGSFNIITCLELPLLLGNRFIYYEGSKSNIENIHKLFNSNAFENCKKISYTIACGGGNTRKEFLLYR